MSEEPQVLVEKRNKLGLITLNRPRVLNSLSHQMLKGIDAALTEFESDGSIAAVLIQGAGERGLCAGGDIVALYRLIQDGDFAAGESYFRDEYRLNYRISKYPKPFISLMDGVVLGGGIGVSAHGSHRIVTENSRLGMPETVIGFSPDIGGLKLLSQAPRQLGTMLAMTGLQMSGADALITGMADYFVPSERLAELLGYLEKATDGQSIDLVIDQFVAEPPASTLAENAHWIATAFAGNDAEAIYQRVRDQARAGNEFASQVLAALDHNSPTGIKMALQGIRRAKMATLAQTLSTDFIVSVNSMRGHDMAEGIRAQVIDKDRNPVWEPPVLGQVSEALVRGFFEAPAGLEPLGLR